MTENTEQLFYRIYKKEPQYTGFCPYRVCPIGAHCDHQHGLVTGFAIDKGIEIAYTPTEDGLFEFASANFPGTVAFSLSSVPEKKQNDWADYLRGAVLSLSARYPFEKALRAVFSGSLPVGGLSSSAAVVLVFLAALCRVNGIQPTKQELIVIANEAENKYVGVGSGRLDQSCELLCEKDKLLFLDTLDESFECITPGKGMSEYKIAIFCSGIERSLVSSKYNMRVDECRAAAYALLAFSGAQYGKFNETFLRDVPQEIFEQYSERLPESWYKRVAHWYGETRRVKEGIQAWREGDIKRFGELCFESGKSSIELWETGSPELKALYEIMLHTDGIYGGRFSGAGFNGACMALIDPKYEREICERVTEEYLRVFGRLRDKFSVHFCDTADGVKL